ncbi:MAG: hypothetical protein M5U16_10660 [Hyphomicrobium sp.]|nr:hypothetical protein [Hyphomicrobium sp.]
MSAKEFMEFSLNEWDDAALEEALQRVEKLGRGEVVAITVGDADADASLLKALAKGAHRAVRIWDPRWRTPIRSRLPERWRA